VVLVGVILYQHIINDYYDSFFCGGLWGISRGDCVCGGLFCDSKLIGETMKLVTMAFKTLNDSFVLEGKKCVISHSCFPPCLFSSPIMVFAYFPNVFQRILYLLYRV